MIRVQSPAGLHATAPSVSIEAGWAWDMVAVRVCRPGHRRSTRLLRIAPEAHLSARCAEPSGHTFSGTGVRALKVGARERRRILTRVSHCLRVMPAWRRTMPRSSGPMSPLWGWGPSGRGHPYHELVFRGEGSFEPETAQAGDEDSPLGRAPPRHQLALRTLTVAPPASAHPGRARRARGATPRRPRPDPAGRPPASSPWQPPRAARAPWQRMSRRGAARSGPARAPADVRLIMTLGFYPVPPAVPVASPQCLHNPGRLSVTPVDSSPLAAPRNLITSGT